MTATGDDPIRMADGHDAELYAKVFGRFGRIHIPGLLREEDARRLHEALAERTPWSTTIVREKVVYDIPPEQRTALTEEQRRTLDQEVFAFARREYGGRYGTCRLSEQGEPFGGPPPELAALTDFLNGPEFIAFTRTVCGRDEIEFADAQATCFEPGDFLHPHTDVQDQKKRAAAYVLNLTPRWAIEWGGLLNYVGDDGHVTEAYRPAWNALNLLDVKHLHFVGCVAPFADAKRYSVTGWLRSR